MSTRVLIVDDEPNMHQLLDDALSMHEMTTTTAGSAIEAIQKLREQSFDVVLTDIRMPEMSGLELCQKIHDNRPDIPVIVMTAFGNLDTAVETIRSGAFDFVIKPFEMDLLLAAVKRAAQFRRLSQQVKMLRHQTPDQRAGSFGSLIGQSPVMLELFELLKRVSSTQSTILITGESGTGKELVARSIHENSNRSDEKFVVVNCAALPESLLESELFGHTKGAFTGAESDKPGLFRRADGGTIFLDEIGEMPAGMQSKLLRVLEESKVMPVGGNSEIAVNARVISATNRDLAIEVENKRFRRDLYFRLNVIPVEVPPLRMRGPDILILAQHFLKHFAQQIDRPIKSLAPAAAKHLMDYRWPGNVRELRNVMERAVALTDLDQISVDDLPENIRNHQSEKFVLNVDDPSQLLPMSEIERQYIQKVLEATNGNKTLAAKLLGFDRTTLYRKIEQLQIKTKK